MGLTCIFIVRASENSLPSANRVSLNIFDCRTHRLPPFPFPRNHLKQEVPSYHETLSLSLNLKCNLPFIQALALWIIILVLVCIGHQRSEEMKVRFLTTYQTQFRFSLFKTVGSLQIYRVPIFKYGSFWVFCSFLFFSSLVTFQRFCCFIRNLKHSFLCLLLYLPKLCFCGHFPFWVFWLFLFPTIQLWCLNIHV